MGIGRVSLIASILILGTLVTGLTPNVFAATEFPNDLAGFNAAATNPPISIDFDSIAANTDITNSIISGVTFEGPGSNLIVVIGANTFTPPEFTGIVDANTNRLFPTTNFNVLSPGGLELGAGPDAAVEEDDLTLIFNSAVPSFGFDILYQSRDGFSFTTITVFDSSNVQIFSASAPTFGSGGGDPGGSVFWGIVAGGGEDIKKIVINEFDDNGIFPDSNIGFDTFRFFVPDPINGPDVPIGGTYIPIDQSALLLAGVQSVSMWMIPVVVAGIGIGVFVIKRKKNSNS